MPAPIVPALLDMFPDTVQVRTWTGQNSFGVATYAQAPGAGVARTAQVSGRVRQVRTSDGRLVTSTVTVIFAGQFGLTVKDEYTLPVRFSPQKPEALAVDHGTDENGSHHETVYF